jgi:hypothetical protein
MQEDGDISAVKIAREAMDALFGLRFKDFKKLTRRVWCLDYILKDAGGFEVNDCFPVRDYKFVNLLLCAIDKGDLEVATFLLDNGMDPNRVLMEDSAFDETVTPLLYAVDCAKTGKRNAVRMFKLLVKYGADVHMVTDDYDGCRRSVVGAIEHRLKLEVPVKGRHSTLQALWNIVTANPS